MSRSVHRAVRAVHRIAELPYGLARTQAAEQEVRRIDAEGPEEVLAYALATLVDSMFWAGEVEKSFVPFTRMVRWWDEHPEHFDSSDRHTLFWMFKWMVADLMEFPAVPAAQIEATIADMARRYTLEGFGMNAVMHQRFIWAHERHTDDADVDAAFAAWCATPRDDFSQCESCEPGDRVAYLVERDRLTEAIELGERTLPQSPSCASEPADLLSHLQLAYLGLGRGAQAAAMHRRAAAHLATSQGTMAGTRGRLIEFLGRSGNAEQAVRRIEADQELLTACDSPRERLSFLLDVGAATHVLRTTAPDLALHLTAVPATTLGELDDWAHREAVALAAEFDARNGTDAWAHRVTKAWSAVAAAPVDLAVLPAVQPLAPQPAERPAEQPTAGPTGDGPPAADAEPPGDDAQDARARAEAAAAGGELDVAAAEFLTASRLAEQVGRTAEAGWALAEAAQCAVLLTDHRGAVAAFERALELLHAADAAPEETVAVVLAFAQAAAELGTPLLPMPVIDTLATRLDELLALPDDELVAPALATRRRTARRRARAELVDVSARLRASAGEHAAAAREAEAAGEALAGLGLPADAAHAFWLAGRMRVALGDTDAAVWHLESAVEGFALAGEHRHRAAAAGELIAALRAVGRDDDADAVTR